MHKILVVDDYEDLTHIMKIYLKAEGYHVDLCFKAEEFLNSVNTFQPDLIILDIYLQGESGCSLCVKLKEAPMTAHIPVILYSAHVFPVDYINHCKYDFFIQKPFELKELSNSIKNLLHLHHQKISYS